MTRGMTLLNYVSNTGRYQCYVPVNVSLPYDHLSLHDRTSGYICQKRVTHLLAWQYYLRLFLVWIIISLLHPRTFKIYLFILEVGSCSALRGTQGNEKISSTWKKAWLHGFMVYRTYDDELMERRGISIVEYAPWWSVMHSHYHAKNLA